MSATTALWTALLAVWVLRLGVLAVNLRTFPVLPPASSGTRRGADARLVVSLLLPARNEAGTLAETLPGLRRQRVDEILVLDDESLDETRSLLAAAAAEDPRIRVLDGAPLPDGWIGKNWACHQLAAAARGDVLIFADADVYWGHGAAEAVVEELARQGADALSVFPRQRTGTLGERAILPLIDEIVLSFLPFVLLRLDVPSAAAAHGALFAFHGDAYWRVGGHAAVRGEILEDVTLARRVRRAGLRLGLALGGTRLAIRMYRGYGETLRGIGKSLRAAHGESSLLVALGAAAGVASSTVPVALVPIEPRFALVAGLTLVSRAVVNAKTRRGAFWEVVLVPLAPLLLLPAYAAAFRRRRQWKGRTYA